MPVTIPIPEPAPAAHMELPSAVSNFAAAGVVIFAALSLGGVQSWAWAAANALLLALLTFCLFRYPTRYWPAAARPALLAAAAFGLLLALQAWAGFSASPGLTRTALFRLAGGGAMLALACLNLRREGVLHTVLRLLSLFLAGLAFESLVQDFTAHHFIYWRFDFSYATPVGPFIYHNHFAGFMLLLIPAAVGYVVSLYRAGNSLWPLYALCPLLGALALVCSLSRGGLAAFVVEVLGLAWLVFPGSLWRKLAVAAATTTAVAASVALTAWGPLWQRLQEIPGGDIGVTERAELWRAAWRIGLAHPLLGTGFGAFPVVYPQFRLFDNGLIVLQAHSDWLETFAGTGVLGLAAALVFLAQLVRATRAARRLSGPERPQRLGAAVACLVFALYAGFDFPFYAPANMYAFFLLAGAVLATPPGLVARR